MNKRTVTLLLTSTSCLLSHSDARSLIGLGQTLRSLDAVDDAMRTYEQPEVDLEQTMDENMKLKE